MDLLFLGGGLWIIPLLTFIGSVIFFVGAWKVRKGGYEKYIDRGKLVPGEWAKDDKKLPIYKSGRFIFAVALLVATALILLAMYSDR